MTEEGAGIRREEQASVAGGGNSTTPSRETKKSLLHAILSLSFFLELTFMPLTDRRPEMMHSFRPVPRTMASYSSSMVRAQERESGCFPNAESLICVFTPWGGGGIDWTIEESHSVCVVVSLSRGR